MMTPKEQYEARKAYRIKRREAKETLDMDSKDILMEDIFDRFVTAFERMADALEVMSRNDKGRSA